MLIFLRPRVQRLTETCQPGLRPPRPSMKRASEFGRLGGARPARLAVCRQGTVVLGVGDGLDVWSLSLRSCCSSNRPLASRRGHTLIRAPQPIGRLAGRHADRQTDRRREKTPCPLKHECSRIKMHARYVEWNPGSYVMQLWFSRIQRAPQATRSCHRLRSRFSRRSQGQAGVESVYVLRHPIRANMTSKMPMAWTRIIFSFQLCMILLEK